MIILSRATKRNLTLLSLLIVTLLPFVIMIKKCNTSSNSEMPEINRNSIILNENENHLLLRKNKLYASTGENQNVLIEIDNNQQRKVIKDFKYGINSLSFINDSLIVVQISTTEFACFNFNKNKIVWTKRGDLFSSIRIWRDRYILLWGIHGVNIYDSNNFKLVFNDNYNNRLNGDFKLEVCRDNLFLLNHSESLDENFQILEIFLNGNKIETKVYTDQNEIIVYSVYNMRDSLLFLTSDGSVYNTRFEKLKDGRLYKSYPLKLNDSTYCYGNNTEVTLYLANGGIAKRFYDVSRFDYIEDKALSIGNLNERDSITIITRDLKTYRIKCNESQRLIDADEDGYTLMEKQLDYNFKVIKRNRWEIN